MVLMVIVVVLVIVIVIVIVMVMLAMKDYEVWQLKIEMETSEVFLFSCF